MYIKEERGTVEDKRQRKEEEKCKREAGYIRGGGGQVGELGLWEPLRWHMPADERRDSQGGKKREGERERERERESKVQKKKLGKEKK